jgi:hypothetical protein
MSDYNRKNSGSRNEHHIEDSRMNIVSDAKLDIDSHSTHQQIVKDTVEGKGEFARQYNMNASGDKLAYNFNPKDSKLDNDRIVQMSKNILHKPSL